MEKIKRNLKNKKWLKIFIPILIILIIAGLLIYSKLSDKGIAVEIAKVKKSNVNQYYDTTGTLVSGSEEKYLLYDGVLVKEVKVKTGDVVCKGDLLATFDTSSMNAEISSKRSALNDARKSYNDAVSDKSDSSARLSDLNAQIDALKAERDKQAETTTSAETTTQAEIDLSALEGTLSEEQIAALKNMMEQRASSQNPLQSFDSQIEALERERSMINTGQYDSVIKLYEQRVDSAKADYDSVVAQKKALDEGWIAKSDGKVAQVYITAGEKYTYVEDESSKDAFASMLSSASNMGDGADLSGLLSGLMDSGDSTKEGLGMVVDYYDGYKVSFSLGKYDVQTVEVGMPAIVKYTDYEYEAEVTFKDSKAQEGGLDIGSMMGSSSTSSNSGSQLMAEATIKNPDDKLVIGFDAKLSILTGSHEKVLTIPVESLVIDEGKKYVYLYDGTTQTAVKREIETGISSETSYEVLSGLDEGDTVIVNSSKVSDGAKVYIPQ